MGIRSTNGAIILESDVRIGQLAKETGLNVQSIRFYERKGLLPSVNRSASGYRIYKEDSIRRIQFIKHAQEVGFSLKEISELLSLKVSGNGSCDMVQQIAAEKLKQLEERLESIERMKLTLTSMMEMCEEGLPARACPILEALDNDS